MTKFDYSDITSSRYSDFGCTIDESLIHAAESQLGCKFPPSFRQFLLEVGGGEFNSYELFTPEHPEVVCTYNISKNNLDYRKEEFFNENQLVFMDEDGQEYFYFDLNDQLPDGECIIRRRDLIDGSDIPFARNLLEFFQKRIDFLDGKEITWSIAP